MLEKQNNITILDPEERFILKNFELQRDERPEIEGLRAAFRSAARKAPFTDKMESVMRDVTPAKRRLIYIQAHEKFFFDQKKGYNRNSMIVVALMGEYAMEPLRSDNDYIYTNLRKSFNRHTPVNISRIGGAVSTLLAVGVSPFAENTREEIFCAHIQALEKAETIKKNFDRFPLEFHEKQLSLVYPSWESFLDRETYLGRHLQHKIDVLVQKTQAKYPSSEIIAFPAPKG